ncbi:hypothetical protein [Halomonas sp. BC04]|uniref:hypothetical protein n=1 Tax=Halomonas sp. BC04 TaxID=1403540 RepID=UPI0003ED6D88|nr:hypothetical protein [Halomonas sp. BC04]EWG99609.1 ferredoxin [Halomonas sp. BC04]
MYIILTSKSNEYDARPDSGISPVETYAYYFYGKKKADFTIAEVAAGGSRVSIVECGDNGQVNSVPIKFFEKFATVEEARQELKQLVTFGTIDTRLEKVAATAS